MHPYEVSDYKQLRHRKVIVRYIFYTQEAWEFKKISKLSFLFLSFHVLRMIVNFSHFLRLIVKCHPILMLNAVEPFSMFVRNSSGEESQNSIILKIERKLFARVTEEVLTIHELHSHFMSYDIPDCTYDPFLHTYLEDIAIIVRLRNYESKVARWLNKKPNTLLMIPYDNARMWARACVSRCCFCIKCQSHDWCCHHRQP